jgi:hypothetical protein
MTLLDENQTSRTSLRGIAFHACSPDNIDLAATAASSREDPSWFNTATVGAVYVSREADTAMDELRAPPNARENHSATRIRARSSPSSAISRRSSISRHAMQWMRRI